MQTLNGSNWWSCLRYLLLACVLGGPNIALAAAKVVDCDGCSSYQNSAEAVSATSFGRVYVTDKINDSITAYDVTTYYMFNPPDTVAVLASTPTHLDTFFDDLIDEFHLAQSPGVEIPVSVAPSAHALVGNSQLQADVSDWLLGVFPPITTNGQPDDDKEEIRGKLMDGDQVVVIFPDNSEAEFTFDDKTVGDDEFDLSDNSLSDAQNNQIPDGASDVDVGDQASFSSGGLGGFGTRDAFVDTLTLLGISTSGIGTSGSGASCVDMVCSSHPTMQVECVFTYSTC